MSKSKIIAITGPSLVGKSTVRNRLESILENDGITTNRVLRATDREQRPGEIDGKEYRFLSQEKMNAAIESGEIIADYLHGGSRYGVWRGHIDTEKDVNLVVIRDPAGLERLGSNVLIPIKPVLLYADGADIDRRIAEQLRNAEKGQENVIKSRLDDFYRELPLFLENSDHYKFIVQNVQSENVYDTTTQLAYRISHALKLDEKELKGKNPREFRSSYIETLTQLLFGKSTEQILKAKKFPHFTYGDMLSEYDKRNPNKSKDDLKRIMPIGPIGLAAYNGILSIYIPEDPANKVDISNVFEMILGLPQFRYDEIEPPRGISPMSLTTIPKFTTNFHLSYSAAFDPHEAPTLEGPLNTLTIESVSKAAGPRVMKVFPLDQHQIEQAWASRKQIIEKTVKPYHMSVF